MYIYICIIHIYIYIHILIDLIVLCMFVCIHTCAYTSLSDFLSCALIANRSTALLHSFSSLHASSFILLNEDRGAWLASESYFATAQS